MKSLILALFVGFSIQATAQANQLAVKCSGQDNDMRQLKVVGMFDQGGFLRHYKFAGAYQIDDQDPQSVQAKNLQGNQDQVEVSDEDPKAKNPQSKNGFFISLPFVLNKKFSDSDTSFTATAIVAKLDGVERLPVLQGEKLACVGTIVKKMTSGGFGGFFEDLGDGLVNFIAQVTFPQFTH